MKTTATGTVLACVGTSEPYGCQWLPTLRGLRMAAGVAAANSELWSPILPKYRWFGLARAVLPSVVLFFHLAQSVI